MFVCLFVYFIRKTRKLIVKVLSKEFLSSGPVRRATVPSKRCLPFIGGYGFGRPGFPGLYGYGGFPLYGGAFYPGFGFYGGFPYHF